MNNKPYGVIVIPPISPEMADIIVDGERMGDDPHAHKTAFIVHALTDEGEEICGAEDKEIAERMAKLANMAFEYGRRYQAAHADEKPDSPYVDQKLFSSESMRQAMEIISNLRSEDSPSSEELN